MGAGGAPLPVRKGSLECHFWQETHTLLQPFHTGEWCFRCSSETCSPSCSLLGKELRTVHGVGDREQWRLTKARFTFFLLDRSPRNTPRSYMDHAFCGYRCRRTFPRSLHPFLRAIPASFFNDGCTALSIQDDLCWRPRAGGYNREQVHLGLVFQEEACRFPSRTQRRCRGRLGRRCQDQLRQGQVLVVLQKPQPCSPLEAPCSRCSHPRVVDLCHHPPRDSPSMDCADLLRMVLHRHYRLPVHSHVSRHASHRSSLGSLCTKALLCSPKIRPLRPGLARSARCCFGLRVRF